MLSENVQSWLVLSGMVAVITIVWFAVTKLLRQNSLLAQLKNLQIVSKEEIKNGKLNTYNFITLQVWTWLSKRVTPFYHDIDELRRHIKHTLQIPTVGNCINPMNNTDILTQLLEMYIHDVDQLSHSECYSLLELFGTEALMQTLEDISKKVLDKAAQSTHEDSRRLQLQKLCELLITFEKALVNHVDFTDTLKKLHERAKDALKKEYA